MRVETREPAVSYFCMFIARWHTGKVASVRLFPQSVLCLFEMIASSRSDYQ